MKDKVVGIKSRCRENYDDMTDVSAMLRTQGRLSYTSPGAQKVRKDAQTFPRNAYDAKNRDACLNCPFPDCIPHCGRVKKSNGKQNRKKKV